MGALTASQQQRAAAYAHTDRRPPSPFPFPPPPTYSNERTNTQLAEGVTFADHFWRTYPSLFLHKCEACNGAGSVICPHCRGYKRRGGIGSGSGWGAVSLNSSGGSGGGGGPGASFRLSELTGPGRARAAASGGECAHCGGYCEWDDESEWEQK